MTLPTIVWIGLAGLLTLAESGCGSGAQIAPALSIATTALRDGMATFPYSQTIIANGGVTPLVWSISFQAPRCAAGFQHGIRSEGD